MSAIIRVKDLVKKYAIYDEPIDSELSSVDYLYEVLLEIQEYENCDEVLNKEIYKVIHDSSLNEKAWLQ